MSEPAKATMASPGFIPADDLFVTSCTRTLDPAKAKLGAPPRAWLVPDPDLRSWNWVRIGQIEDLRGRRRDALRAYRKTLALPDLRGAHDEAEKGISAPYARPTP